MDVFQADNSVKYWWNLSISNPIQDFHNINTYTKFGENPLTFIQVIIQKQKYGWTTDGQESRGMDTDETTNMTP